MLNKIKNKLSIKDRIIPVDYWQVTISGKVLELRVTPSFDQDPANYRLGVIQIGRIIYRIKSIQEKSSTKPRINLFPNLSENQLAATIFWPQLLKSHVHLSPGRGAQKTISVSNIRELANKYNMFLKKQPAESMEHQKDENKYCYALLTYTNQPFVWLKLGQFIEELKCSAVKQASFSLDNLSLMNAEKSSMKTGHESDNFYLQALIYLPENEKTI